MSNLISNSRGVDKYTSIANEIRRRINTGQFSPGSQLPQRTELEESFQVSKVTLQRAMNLLIEDGFIDATRNKGSFVVERPPHLSRYAMAFQGQPNPRSHLSQFWVAFAHEGARREREGECSMPLYYGIDGHTDTPAFQKLSREINEHRLAGLIYVSNHSQQPDLSMAQEAQLPCVIVDGPVHHQAPVVTVSWQSFMLRALDYVASKGCRRVAFLRHGGDLELDYLAEALASRGLETRPFWMQGVSVEIPESARNCMHLLMHGGQKERPDALIITDDNLVEPGTRGLVDAGIRPSDDVVVVAHANFPYKTPSYMEAQRLGYDVHQILSACIHSINRQRAGEEIPSRVALPALFEHEMESSRATNFDFAAKGIA